MGVEGVLRDRRGRMDAMDAVDVRLICWFVCFGVVCVHYMRPTASHGPRKPHKRTHPTGKTNPPDKPDHTGHKRGGGGHGGAEGAGRAHAQHHQRRARRAHQGTSLWSICPCLLCVCARPVLWRSSRPYACGPIIYIPDLSKHTTNDNTMDGAGGGPRGGGADGGGGGGGARGVGAGGAGAEAHEGAAQRLVIKLALCL